VATIIVVQMAMPEKLGEFQLLTTLYMAPPPPPPAPAVSAKPQPARHAPQKPVVQQTPTVVQQQPQPIQDKPVVAPTAIPSDIARIVESGPASAAGAPGGVPGGVRGGIPGGLTGSLLGGVLGGAVVADVPPPPTDRSGTRWRKRQTAENRSH